MKKNNIEWINYLLLGVSVLMSAIAYPFLPAEVPIHWNYEGVIDGYGPKLVVLAAIPIGIVLIYLLLRFMPRIDPRKKNYEKFSKTYVWFRVIIVTIFVMLQGVILLATFGVSLNIGMVIQIVLGILFILLGNLMPKVQPTYFIGVRTPWTLASDLVWRKTHQLTGKLWVVCGFLMLPMALVPNLMVQITVLIILIVIMVLVPMVYSYFIYKKI